MRKRASAIFGVLHARHEDADQLVGFVKEWRGIIFWNEVGSGEKFDPVRRFVQLLECSLQFADELGIGSRSMRFAVMRADPRVAAEEPPREVSDVVIPFRLKI